MQHGKHFHSFYPFKNNIFFLNGLWYMGSSNPRIMQINFIIPRNMHFGSILSLFNHASSSTHFYITKAIWSNVTIKTTKMTNWNEMRNYTIALCIYGSLPSSLRLSGFNPSPLLNRSILLPMMDLHDCLLPFLSQMMRNVGLRLPS